MRLKFETLLDVQDYYGSSDFQIEARYDKFDGEEYIMLDSVIGSYIMKINFILI